MVPAAVGTQSGGLPQPEGEAPSLPEGEHGSEMATAFQLSAFVWKRRWQVAGAHQLSVFVLLRG